MDIARNIQIISYIINMTNYRSFRFTIIFVIALAGIRISVAESTIAHNGYQLPNKTILTLPLHNSSSIDHPDLNLDTEAIINKYGYNGETHWITTDDGYILRVHRIGGIKGNTSVGKFPVLLIHGLLCSSSDWILPGPNRGIGYLISDAGYDVWMGNIRGNKYSRNHTTLNLDSKEFWDFSWHEAAIHDLPAMIDYILLTTGHKQLFYVGHSQGTTNFYVMASELPEYNNKIKAMFSLAPVSFLGHMISPVFYFLAQIADEIAFVLDSLGEYEFKPMGKLVRTIKSTMCSDYSVIQIFCANELFMICGYSPDQMNTTLLPLIFNHAPAGASVKQVLHYAQLVNSGKFRQFDFGKLRNKYKYGTFDPPEYNISKITTPVALFYSEKDWLSQPEDVELLYKQLPNCFGKYNIDKFNHLDFIWGIDVKQAVYYKIQDLMTQYK